MKRQRIILLFLIVTLGIYGNGYGQSLQNWTVYDTTNSGLPSNYIYSIAIAGNNVWIGTGDSGVAKFDGTTWAVYNTTNSGLPDNAIYSIAIAGNGGVWIGTFSNGVAKFDGTNWTVYDTTNSGLPSDYIYSIASAGNNIWIGTDSGLAKFNGTTWTVYDTTNSGLPDDYIYSIASAGNDIWIGTAEQGVAVYNNSQASSSTSTAPGGGGNSTTTSVPSGGGGGGGGGSATTTSTIATNTSTIPMTTTTSAPLPSVCITDADCDDGQFCNGRERCINNTCVPGDNPCAAGQLCKEDLDQCWDIVTLNASCLQNSVRKPAVRATRCPWLLINCPADNHFSAVHSTITIEGSQENWLGVAVDDGKNYFKVGNIIFIPICIEKAATPGQWKVKIKTDGEGGTTENSFEETIEAPFQVQ